MNYTQVQRAESLIRSYTQEVYRLFTSGQPITQKQLERALERSSAVSKWLAYLIGGE